MKISERKIRNYIRNTLLREFRTERYNLPDLNVRGAFKQCADTLDLRGPASYDKKLGAAIDLMYPVTGEACAFVSIALGGDDQGRASKGLSDDPSDADRTQKGGLFFLGSVNDDLNGNNTYFVKNFSTATENKNAKWQDDINDTKGKLERLSNRKSTISVAREFADFVMDDVFSGVGSKRDVLRAVDGISGNDSAVITRINQEAKYLINYHANRQIDNAQDVDESKKNEYRNILPQSL